MRNIFKKDLLVNKLFATLLIALGWLTTLIDGDGTAFVLLAFVGVGVFFAKTNVITIFKLEEK